MSAKDPTERTFLRVIDANLNRAGEAARVVEDCARFVLDHPGLANSAKSIRHRLALAVESLGLDTGMLLESRDTEGDVGTSLVGEREGERTNLGGILRANFQRLTQSLRVLEEYSKMPGGAAAAAFETMRYDVYTLEKQFAAPPEKPGVLDDKPLMVLVGTSMTPGGTRSEVIDLTRRILAGGASLIELREKEMPDGECLALARALRELTRDAGALLIVNDRVDVARAADADGVHLGLDDLPIEEARRVLGPSKLVGLTAHSIDELTDAERRGADYIGVGTMFASPTKPDLEVKGPAELIPATARCTVPCYAIGGVSRDNVDEVLAMGTVPFTDLSAVASAKAEGRRIGTVPNIGIVVGSAITSADDVTAETKWFVSRLTE